MKLEYRDGWPTRDEVIAHREAHDRSLWMVQFLWPTGGTAPPEIYELVHLTPADDCGVCVKNWPDGDLSTDIETSEIPGSYRVAPLDDNGGPVSWPKAEG